MADTFVRIDLDLKRKLRFKHKDLRDLVASTGKSIGELFSDPFGGWPHIMLHALRHQDLKLTLDKCSEFIDLWVEKHADEEAPLNSLGEKLLEALNASGFVRIKADTKMDETPASGELAEVAEGND